MALKDHLGKLEYFCKVAECKSILQASIKAHVTQPQLSRVMKQLEEDLGKQLIVRSSTGVQLTMEGVKLYESATQILKQVNTTERNIKYGSSSMKGEIRIGTYDSIARYFFPDFLKYLRSTAPDIKIYLETGRSNDIYKKLKDEELDMAIIVTEEKKSKIIDFQKIYQDSFGLYQSTSLPIDYVNKLIYFHLPINETEKTMGGYGFDESIVCDNLETVRSLIEQSIGVGLLPHRVAKESILSKKMLPFKHNKIKINSFDTHDIYLCHHKANESLEKKFVFEETMRFLDFWSKV